MRARFALFFFIVCLALLTLYAPRGDTPAPKTSASPRTDPYGDPLPDGAAFRIGTTRLRHHINYIRPSQNVLFSPNGKYLLSSLENEGAIYMWEAATGRELRQFPAAPDSNPRLALSSDGSLLAVSDTTEIFLYDTATGKKRNTIDLSPLKASYVDLLSFSPDGKILTASQGGQSDSNDISRWETATGKLLGTTRMAKEESLHVFSADSRLVVSSNYQDKSISLWETATGHLLRDWQPRGKMPVDRRLRFSPDDRYLAMSSNDERMIRVFDAATGKEVRSWPIPMRMEDAFDTYPIGLQSSWVRQNFANWLAFAPESSKLASVDSSCVLHIWDWKTGRELHYFKGVSGRISFSPDGKIIAAGGSDTRIRLWDTETGKDLCPFADPGKIAHVAFSPDGRTLAAGSERGPTYLLDARTGRELKHFPGYRPIAFAPTGRSLLVVRPTGRFQGRWSLVDAATGREIIQFRDAEVDSYCWLGGWDAEKKLLLIPSTKSVRVWDTKTGKMLREIRGYPEGCQRNCSPDGRLVAATIRQESVIRIFAADTGKELRQLTGYDWSVRADAHRDKENVAVSDLYYPVFSPDSKVLLAGCKRESWYLTDVRDKLQLAHVPDSLGLWDLSTGKRFLGLSCPQFLPNRPLFSPNGDLLALLDTRGDPCLVDVKSGQVRHRLTWPGGDLSWILKSDRAFSPDGRLFAVTYDPHTLVLWEVATGRPIRTWPGHDRGDLWQMVFSPDSRRLATVSTDGTALVWDVMGLSTDGQLPARKLRPAEAEQAWSDLGDADAAKGHRAIWMLVADPARARPLLRQRLHPVSATDPHRLAWLIAGLDSDDGTVRDTAMQELKQLDELAQPALRAALRNKRSAAFRRRVQRLLDELDAAPLPAESLRGLRAVAVLEHIGSDEARQVLGALAAGAPEARLTQDAKASLARLRSGLVRGR